MRGHDGPRLEAAQLTRVLLADQPITNRGSREDLLGIAAHLGCEVREAPRMVLQDPNLIVRESPNQRQGDLFDIISPGAWSPVHSPLERASSLLCG